MIDVKVKVLPSKGIIAPLLALTLPLQGTVNI